MLKMINPARSTGKVLWILACLPILVVAVLTSVNLLSNLTSPCVFWGATGTPVSVAQGGTCPSVQSFSETAQQAVFGLILIQGGILAGVALGIVGTLKSRPSFLLVASVILFAESIPLVFDGLFIFSVIPAALFVWSGRLRQI